MFTSAVLHIRNPITLAPFRSVAAVEMFHIHVGVNV
jgi:hypothetical protein